MSTNFALFLASAVVIALIPGPSIFYVAARTLAAGRSEGLASTLGMSIGGLVHILAGAFGVSALIMASAEAFTLMKLAGAAYLIWLGIKTFRTARIEAPQNVEVTGAARAFRQGIVVEITNPKTASYFLAFLPQFIDVSQPVALQFMILGVISVVLNGLVDLVVVVMAGAAREGLDKRPDVVARIRQGSGLIMAGLGASLLVARRAN